MPRPKVEINLKEVERLSGLGLTQEEISLALGISESTLYNRKRESEVFTDAIKRGKAKASEVVSNKLMGLCKQGNLGAIIWYEKTRRGLSDRLNVSSDDLNQRIEEELARLADLRSIGISQSNQAGSGSSRSASTSTD